MQKPALTRFTRIFALTLRLLLLAALLWPTAAARGQTRLDLRLVQVDAARFPVVQVYFEAYDASRRFITDLKDAEVSVSENEITRPVDELTRLQTGVQFVVAINEAPELSNRHEGVSRFEALSAHLQAWAGAQKATTTDDFSLAGNNGLQFIRLANPGEWTQALQTYQPNLLSARAGLTSLNAGLDLATDPNPNPFMKRALLYVTPLPASADLPALNDLTNRARQLGVQVSVWLVAAANAETTNAAAVEALRQFSAETGGHFFLFSGAEALPDLDAWLEPLRYTYRLTYTSGVNTSGRHTVAVEVERRNQTARSSERSVTLRVEPPNPMFLSPPASIARTWSEPADGEAAVLVPESAPLQILVEFPDEHARPLAATRLFVDGVLVQENTSEPFDTFEWDISGEQTSASRILQVEAEDTLGLTGRSIETPVQISVEMQAPRWYQRLLSPDRLVGYGAILAAGIILGLAIFLRARTGQAARPAEPRWRSDPVTQPVIVPEEKPRTRIPRPRWPHPTPAAQSGGAWLRPVKQEPGAPPPLSLAHREITFGSDPQQATCLLDDPSVSPLHARLTYTPAEGYVLADCGSVAGTWVNYAPISRQGVPLNHGDLIQIGRVSLRFELAAPSQIRQPRVESHQSKHEPD